MKSDSELIEETLAGLTESFGFLVQRHQNRLFTSMARLLDDPEEAEDVAQEAFVQSYRKLDTFQGASAFYTWIYRIAFNIAAGRRRRRRPTESLERRGQGGREPEAGTEPIGLALEREEEAKRLWEALGRLSDEHRTIMVMREMEGHDYETIGQMLDIPVGTVRSRLHRARSQLRDLLTGDMAPG